MALKIASLSDALGVEVTGVNFNGSVSERDVEAMRVALAEHLVMVVRDQHLDPAQLLSAVRRCHAATPF